MFLLKLEFKNLTQYQTLYLSVLNFLLEKNKEENKFVLESTFKIIKIYLKNTSVGNTKLRFHNNYIYNKKINHMY